MSRRRRRPRRRHARRSAALLLTPTANANASAKVQLALRVRQDANLAGRCVCGAVGEAFTLDADGTVVRVTDWPPSAPMAVYVRYEHEADCPAVSPELDRALERGEITDPGGDLLRGLVG
jgi:hypothetical protein